MNDGEQKTMWSNLRIKPIYSIPSAKPSGHGIRKKILYGHLDVISFEKKCQIHCFVFGFSLWPLISKAIGRKYIN